MSQYLCAPVAVGVDVGGLKKGFHAVALREGQFTEKLATLEAVKLVGWCRKLDATVVGIDAPCCWSRTGRARLCERELATQGMFAFATPSQSKGEQHPFYRWMCNGMKLYDLLASEYRLFDGRETVPGPICFETFPHAVACALAGQILSAKRKRTDRPRLLRAARFSTDSLGNIDMVDAALCALTADLLLAGKCKSYGDVKEGFIVVPNGLPT